MNHPNAARRSGFTLIEILVVIAIIAILAALIMGGVMAYMSKGPELQVRNDLLQLNTALDRFYAEYKFYPPDTIKLCSNYGQYNKANALDKASLAYIGTMWPNINWNTPKPWAGGITLPATGIVLEGDQCLVFFLGGPPIGTTPGLMGGFSVDPRDPISLGQTVDRKRFMEFDTGRLINRGGSPFPSMIDRWGKNMPYVYFSSGRYGYGGTANTLNVAPYIEPPVPPYPPPPYPLPLPKPVPPHNYYQKSRFQIICAGRDGLFGPGGLLNPWSPALAGSMAMQGRDDMTNFYDNKLGVP